MTGLNLARPSQSLETSPIIESNSFYPSPSQHANNGYELATIDEARAVAEVQSSMIIAKRFPRDEIKAYSKIEMACTRVSLAKNATYAYPRGGTTVTGASIRLAEVLANAWGNIDYGYREIGSGHDYTDVEAYAFDKESNAKACRAFRISHFRRSKQKGNELLTDPRDIYEHVASQASRRIRACILQIIPGDIVESALEKCKETLKNAGGGVPLVDRVRKMASSFQNNFGITIEMIEKRLGHKLDSTIEEELLQLGSIFTSIRDGASKREKFFDLSVSSDGGKQEERKEQSPQPAIENKSKVKGSLPEAKTSKATAVKTSEQEKASGDTNYSITCPNTGKQVDEIDCANKPCRTGCPAFE